MANAFFTSFKKLLADGDIDLLNDTIQCILVDTADYTFNAAHDFYDDITAAGRVGTAQTLGSKTTTGGVFDAADATFPAVTGDGTEAIVIFKNAGGAESTWPLIAYIDNAAVTPNGGDIVVQWNASGIFSVA